MDPEGVHLCLNICGKPLSCGIHACELFCHLGNCPKCPIIINQAITCQCGKTRLNPPLPCGTKPPECDQPCTRQRPCGHPCSLNCHQGDCPPCTFPVSKKCICGKEVIANVSCSKEAMCLEPCNKAMSCGHPCLVVCHTGRCPKDADANGCGKKCGKLKICGHQCLYPCHPGKECPNEECKTEIRVVCQCGFREAYIQCMSTRDQVVNQLLVCNASCKNFERFKLFYQQNASKQVYYASNLLKFAKYHYNFLLKLEAKIYQMIKESRDSFEIPFMQEQDKRQAVYQLLTKHYKLETQYYNRCKNPFFTVFATKDMIIPNVLLSQYLTKVQSGEIQLEQKPFELTLKFSKISKGDSLQHLKYILKDYENEYYIEFDKKQNLYVQFWSKECGEAASQLLKKSSSSFSAFMMEVNQSNYLENEKSKFSEDEIVRSQKQFRLNQMDALENSSDEAQKPRDEAAQQKINSQRERYKGFACLYKMCSEGEIAERDQKFIIDIFEQDPRQQPVKIFPKWMVKMFVRNTASQLPPEEIRTPDVIHQTVQYLVDAIVDTDILVNTIYKLPLNEKNKKRMHTFKEVYDFASDRFKACRQELAQMLPQIDIDWMVIRSLEWMARFYIIALYEGPLHIPMFEEQFNHNEIVNVLGLLLEGYQRAEKQLGGDQTQLKELLQNRGEFVSYHILINIERKLSLQQSVQRFASDPELAPTVICLRTCFLLSSHLPSLAFACLCTRFNLRLHARAPWTRPAALVANTLSGRH